MLMDLRKQYLETGVIVVPKIWDDKQVGRMRLICEHVLSQWRLHDPQAGHPGIDHPNATAMRHLNHPDYFTHHRPWLVELLEAIADPRVIDVVREVFDDEVLFRCTSLFINPLESGEDGHWHRDGQFTAADEEQERREFETQARLLREQQRVSSIQLQIALVPSDDSEYVPGSHLQWDDPDQYFIRQGDGQKHNRSNLMPGRVTAHQEPGDAAAFNPYGLHRGRYHADKYRRTIMLTYTAMSSEHHQDFFTDQPWCMEEGYLNDLSPHARAFFERFIDVYRDFWTRPRQ